MKIQPQHDGVLVQFDTMEAEFGQTGIIRPDIARDKPVWATVLGVGPGKVNKRGNRIPCTVTRGNRVLVPWRRGTEMTINGVPHAFVHEYAEDDILAVEESED